ncbi:RNA methyltransferase, partial [Listeria monocytogenes]|nr:RNA methyltransferase [Listeria monocytogenes]
MEQENEQEWIGGRNPVLEVLRSDRDIHKIYVQEGSQKGVLKQVLTLAKERKIQVQFVPKQKIEKVVSGVHQGVAAQVAAYQYAELDDLFAAAEAKDEMPFFIILDELEDPHNLGSIMRTADSVGAHGIIIPKRRSVGLTQTVAKASTGAMEYVPVVRVTNMVRT